MMTKEDFLRATNELMSQKKLSLEEVDLVKMRFGVGYPTPLAIEEIAKTKNQKAIIVKIRLRYIEQKILKDLNNS